MSLISDNCPNCGAPQSSEIDTFFCSNCGTKLHYDDGTKKWIIEHVYRTIDEARIAQEETHRRRIELDAEARERDRNDKQFKTMLVTLVLVSALVFIPAFIYQAIKPYIDNPIISVGQSSSSYKGRPVAEVRMDLEATGFQTL